MLSRRRKSMQGVPAVLQSWDNLLLIISGKGFHEVQAKMLMLHMLSCISCNTAVCLSEVRLLSLSESLANDTKRYGSQHMLSSED